MYRHVSGCHIDVVLGRFVVETAREGGGGGGGGGSEYVGSFL